MSEVSKHIYNLEQIYLYIGEQHDQIRSTLNLPLLDPSATLDPCTTFRLALITAFQFAEGLSDAAAAKATMTRKDWKCALRLPVKHPGFTPSMLCKFRESLNTSAAALQEMKKLLDDLEKAGLYSKAVVTTLRPDEAVSRVCMITRFAELKQAMKSALGCLIATSPDFLRANALPHWYERYKTGQINQTVSLTEDGMLAEAARLGKDIQHLLDAVTEQGLSELAGQVELQRIERLLKDDFIASDESIAWRQPDCAICNCRAMGSGGFS